MKINQKALEEYKVDVEIYINKKKYFNNENNRYQNNDRKCRNA